MFSYLKSFLVSHASKLILSLLVGVPVITTVSIIISNQIAKKEPIDLQPEEVVRRLQEDYPGWQDKLFACPCTEDEIIQQRIINAKSYPLAPAGLGELAVEEFENNHPGAKGFYRSVAPEEYRPEGRKDLYPLRPGQQCTYDENGRLITHGPAAGTPDAYGSNATDSYFFTSIGKGKISGLHRTWDVDTYKKLGWREYHKIWKPNNGNSCLFNPSPATPQELKQVSKLIFPKGWKMQQDGRNVYQEHWLDTIRVFRNDDLNGFPRTLYEVKTRMVFQYEGQSDKNEKKSKVWVQCSKNNPLVIHHPELGYHPYPVMTDSENPIMEVVRIAPGSFVPMVRIWENGLYWAVCHGLSEIDYSFYESENAKQYGYSPGLEDKNYEALTQGEFIQGIYR